MTGIDVEEIVAELSSFIVRKVEIARFRPRTRPSKRKKIK